MSDLQHDAEKGPRHIADLLEALVATWPAQAQQRLRREVARCADVEAAA